MKFTTAFYTLALSFAAVTGSADARIGQKMSSDAFESRMMSGTQDDICRNGQICDPSAATVCGVGKSNWCKSMECILQTPSGEYRCQDGFNGRKLVGDPTSTPGSDAPTCGEFEVVCDANIQALGVNCALLSCVDCTPLLVDSGVNCTPEPTADARIGQQMSSDAFESRMMSETQGCDDNCCNGQICDPSAAMSCGAGRPACDASLMSCTFQTSSGEYRCQSGF